MGTTATDIITPASNAAYEKFEAEVNVSVPEEIRALAESAFKAGFAAGCLFTADFFGGDIKKGESK